MNSKSKRAFKSLRLAVLAIVFMCGSQTVLRAEGATYHQYIWSGGQRGFAGVLLLDSAYCRYDSSEGVCDLIGPGSYVTTPGGQYDLWQLQEDGKLRVRATFSSTQLRQLYITQTGSPANGLPEGLTLTQNYTNEAVAPTAILGYFRGKESGSPRRDKCLDLSGSWKAAAGPHAISQADRLDALKRVAVSDHNSLP
jgi:hypothetical protein